MNVSINGEGEVNNRPDYSQTDSDARDWDKCVCVYIYLIKKNLWGMWWCVNSASAESSLFSDTSLEFIIEINERCVNSRKNKQTNNAPPIHACICIPLFNYPFNPNNAFAFIYIPNTVYNRTYILVLQQSTFHIFWKQCRMLSYLSRKYFLELYVLEWHSVLVSSIICWCCAQYFLPSCL